MRGYILPEWLRAINQVIGFEENSEEQEEEEGEEEEEEEEESSDTSKAKGKEDEDVDGLKSALSKERKERKKFEREFKRLQKQLNDLGDKDKTESEKAKNVADKEKAKSEKLAARLRNQALDFQISKVAQRFKFRDVDDALGLVSREAIEVDQDEDDPSEIEIDEKSVENAVKALAKKRPHLVKTADEGEEDEENGTGRTGSKFGGRKKDSEKLGEEKLREKYPALGR